MSLISERLAQLPHDSGVYLMKDRRGAIIYVGKAKNLKNRVSSYFQSGSQHTYKTRALVAEIVDFDLMLTQSEVEALLLERTLIRHHQPRYNILLRDDKEYPFLRICFEDPWPRIQKVRRRKEDGAHYIGPFSSSSRLNMLLKQVYKIFPLIRCSVHEFKTATRPCNYYHMKMCLGPCTLPVDRDLYVGLVRDAVSLLEGNVSDLKKQLTFKMEAAARAERYEAAAQMRDQIRAIDLLTQQQVAILSSTVDADIIGSEARDQFRAFHVSNVRNRTLLGGDHYIVERSAGSDQEELASFILQYYARRPIPKRIIVRSNQELGPELAAAIAQAEDFVPSIESARPGEEMDLLEIAERNAEHQMEVQQGVRTQQQVALQMLRETLSLPRWPERIECIDISNLQGMAIVASDVCFMNGKPAKDLYRRYEIKTVTGAPDDFASMREVVERRLNRALHDDDLPDLLIIDGGRPQVEAVKAIISNYPQLDLPFVGIAKSRLDKGPRDDSRSIEATKERLVLPEQEYPIELEEGTPLFRLVTRIRDEAHRFAITYHRKKRSKISHKSILDEIAGIGPTLKKRLLQEFGSVEGIRNASLDRLLGVKGMNEKTAINLHSLLGDKTAEKEQESSSEA